MRHDNETYWKRQVKNMKRAIQKYQIEKQTSLLRGGNTGSTTHTPGQEYLERVGALPASTAPTGLRYDTGKVRLDLLPAEWIWGLGQVMTAGAAKYEPRNWEKGMAWSKVLGPTLRHWVKWLAGEMYDPETECHHLAMVAWNALALMVYQLRMIGTDDVFPVVPVRLEGVRKEKGT